MLIRGMIWIVEIYVERIIKNGCGFFEGYPVFFEISRRFPLVPLKAHAPYLSTVRSRTVYLLTKLSPQENFACSNTSSPTETSASAYMIG